MISIEYILDFVNETKKYHFGFTVVVRPELYYISSASNNSIWGDYLGIPVNLLTRRDSQQIFLSLCNEHDQI